MLLRSIKLENIRSYTNQEVSFPEGSLLLSGDVGSGKSSILLGIEFALFGIRGKRLSGNSLLRNGKNEGSVELSFSIDDKDVVIKRKLKRGKDNVGQVAGYIIKDGVKKEATPVELKSDIVNLLGYPKELVSKSKNLVYRYTVYTPQEEMKQILIEDEETRLDTLRKVFGIDKYKRIRENSLVYIRELKEKVKEFQGMISDLEEKKTWKKGKEDEINLIKENISLIEPKLLEAREKVTLGKEKISLIEDKIQEQNNLKRELEVLENELKHTLGQRMRNKENIELLEKQINLLKDEVVGKETNVEEIEQEERLVEESIILEERKLQEIEAKLNELNVKKKSSVEIKEKVINLDKCFTCQQNVGLDHKRFISEKENENIAKFDQGIKEYLAQSESVNKKDKELNFKLGELLNKQKEFSAVKVKIKNIQEKSEMIKELVLQQDILKKKIGSINVKKIELNKKIVLDVFSEYDRLKLELEKVMSSEKNLEIEMSGFTREKESLSKYILEIEKEISEKIEAKKKMNYLLSMQEWIESSFVKLMAVMEKHIMFSVYNEFNELFQNWFNILMGDETLNARLDDSFSPIIEQNGYETDVGYLSGGERTAAALAYRLALNKVVNDMMGTIKTKDLIILDEPTDGFSAEQLDRVRDVLDQIGVKQTIIVSHETKIESFVENVIRINKSGHVSEIE